MHFQEADSRIACESLIFEVYFLGAVLESALAKCAKLMQMTNLA